MRLRLQLVATVLLLSAIPACSTEAPQSSTEGTWVGTIRTEGNVTTVLNESGSVWGGTATLVEEASIGVDAGEDPYMLGNLSGIAVRDDEVFVLDSSVPVVRVYDAFGAHLRDIGGRGEGPGEFGTGLRSPVGIAFDDKGLLYVHARSKIEIFTVSGERVDTWTLDRARARQEGVSLVVPRSGLVLLAERIRCGEKVSFRCGMATRRVEEGLLAEEAEPMPDLGYKPPDNVIEMRRGSATTWLGSAPPFVPGLAWAIGPQGDLVLGRADRYEFERHHLDGTITKISRYWDDPVPVLADEGDWYLRRERLHISREGVTYVGTYDLSEGLPGRKPAFRGFVPAHDGGVWVVRAGPGEPLAGCDLNAPDARAMYASPCWRDATIIDAFDEEGRYLGTVKIPSIWDNRSFPILFRHLDPFIDGNQVFVAVEDEAGTIMVKRYRLVPPG